MATKIGSLLIDLQANVAQLQKDLRDAQSTLKSAVSNMESTLKTFGAAVAAYFAADKVIGFARSTIDAAGALVDMSTRTGVAVESLSGLQYAAELNSASISDLEKGLKTLSERAARAAAGNVEAGNQFRRFGVAVTTATGELRPTEELLYDIADRLAAMPASAARAEAAMRLIGEEAGLKLLPMLSLGRKGLEDLRREAERVGVVVSTSAAQAALDFGTALTRLQRSVHGVGVVILEEVAPTLNTLTAILTEAAQESRGFGEGLVHALRLVVSAGMVAANILSTIGRTLGAIAAMAVELMQSNLRGVKTIYAQVSEDNRAAWDQMYLDIARVWGAVEDRSREGAQTTASSVSVAVAALPDALQRAADEAQRIQREIADSMLRVAVIEASLTRDRTDDIIASYRQQYAALQRRIGDEKTSEEERVQFLRELDALRLKERQELEEALRESTRATIDAELHTRLKEAQATATRLDDIRAQLAMELESIRRQEEDGLLDPTLAQRQRVAAHRRAEREMTEATQREAAGRRRIIEQQSRAAAAYFGGAFADLVLLPLQDGFRGVQDLLTGIRNLLLDIIRRISESVLVQMLLTAMGVPATPGRGFLSLLGFHSGGLVPGRPTPGRDSVVAALEPGEYVVRAAAVQRYGRDFLDALNSMELPRFQRGGLVEAAPAGAACATSVVINEIAAFDPRSMLEVLGATVEPAMYRRAATRGDAKMISGLRRRVATPRTGRTTP